MAHLVASNGYGQTPISDDDENDYSSSGQAEEDDFDCFYSYLLEREQNKDKAPKGKFGQERAPSPVPSASIATDSSNDESGIWKTLGDAKKRQQEIRSRIQRNKSPERQENRRASTSSVINGSQDNNDDSEKPDSAADLKPEDVVKMVVRRASMSGALPLKKTGKSSSNISNSSSTKNRPTETSAANSRTTSYQSKVSSASSRTFSDESDQDYEGEAHRYSSQHSRSTRSSQSSGARPVTTTRQASSSSSLEERASMRRDNPQAPPPSELQAPVLTKKWKKSTANLPPLTSSSSNSFNGYAGASDESSSSQVQQNRNSLSSFISSGNRRRSMDAETGSVNSDLTGGLSQYFDAVQDLDDDIMEMDDDEYRRHVAMVKKQQQQQEQYFQEEDEEQAEYMGSSNVLTTQNSLPQIREVDFPLVKPLPFIEPTFDKPDPEEESDYDEEAEFERLYGEDNGDDDSFDKEYYDRIYGEYNDERDPEERERERRQQEWEAKQRGEEVDSEEDDSEYDDDEEEERGLMGNIFSSVANVGANFGVPVPFFGMNRDARNNHEDEDDEDESDEERPATPSPRQRSRKSNVGSPTSGMGIFGAFRKKPAKNPPKRGAPPPSRELEIIKKCQQQWKLREQEAALREARQKEQDKENLRMRREEERDRARVKREVEDFRETMIEMGKADKLAKTGKAAADEYDDRLAMEGTLKEQQQKAQEMQERLEEVDEGDKKSKKKKKQRDDDDSDSSSEYEAGCCCIIS